MIGVEKKLESILKKFNLNKIPSKDNFLKKGIIDSLIFIKFILEIEKKFKIKIPPNLFFSDNAGTVSGIKKLILKSLKIKIDKA
jgi:acyl carrier protein